MIGRRTNRATRKGATVVEMAIVLPVFLLFVFAIIEFGHALLVNNMLNVACRASARYGSTQGVTTADVRSRAENLYSTLVDADAVTLIVKSAAAYDNGASLPQGSEEFQQLPNIEVADAEPRDLFLVRAEVNYNDIAILRLPFMDGLRLTGHSVTRHE